MFYAEPAPAQTRASSARQLPTDHVPAVPTREYQSDQASRQLLRCHSLCCLKREAPTRIGTAASTYASLRMAPAAPSTPEPENLSP